MRKLFPEPEIESDAETMPAADAPAPGVFAEVVFDRPLDQAYSYRVPQDLAATLQVGQRVEVPFGRGDKGTPGFVVGISNIIPSRAVKEIRKALDTAPLVDDNLLRLTRWMADYYLCGWGQVLSAVVPAGVRDKAGTRNTAFVMAVPSEELPTIVPSVTPKQKQALEALRRENRAVEVNELARLAKVTPGIVTGLVTKGLAKRFYERVEKDIVFEDDSPIVHTDNLTLNNDQTQAWNAIEPALSANEFKPFLLHGVTGSGKTEIYLRAIEAVVKAGREAIVLVPEISLTPQTTERFRGRGGRVAVLHSHLTDAERAAYWRKVAAGQIDVVVGARSAVFAPTRRLGLIIIDEEHETSFKQESTPRYHARDVAVMRARLENLPILMGSATPALESWHNAKKGTYQLLDLPTRVESRPMPEVRLVDLRHEPKTPGKHFAISPSLEGAMKKALADGGQIMLLLNRRGFSTHVQCPSCGTVAQCAHCDLGLTFHRTRAAMVCHYCGWETAPMHQCAACGTTAMKYQGLGTEKLQQEVEDRFPGKVVQRMDSDTMSKPGSHRRVLDAFKDGLIHVLLGTQMIAKGLDFPNVTLVGVINADVGLHLPDFRSAERTFQLLAQVAGRAGRGDKPGRVLVQTYTPEHACIALAAKHDYITFAGQELAFRKEHGYPPYQRLARLIVRSQKEDAANAFANTLAGAFKLAISRHAGQPKVRVLGPAECPVFRLNDYFRFHFQLQSESSGTLHAVLREVVQSARPPHGVEFQVDVDPYGMM